MLLYEQASMPSCRGRSSNIEESKRVHLRHQQEIVQPILRGVLDYAQSVNSEMADSQSSRETDSVPERLWKLVNIDTFPELVMVPDQ